MTLTKEIVSEIDSRFTSLNPIPVERATIRRDEWEALKCAIDGLRAERDELARCLDGIAADALTTSPDEPEAPQTDEKGRPITYWGEKPAEPAARNVTTVAGIECMGFQGRHRSGLDTDARLNACPFCGHPAAFRAADHGGGYSAGHPKNLLSVECTNGGCGVMTPEHYPTRENALEAWNRRAVSR